jgi:hypothetical protein
VRELGAATKASDEATCFEQEWNGEAEADEQGKSVVHDVVLVVMDVRESEEWAVQRMRRFEFVTQPRRKLVGVTRRVACENPRFHRCRALPYLFLDAWSTPVHTAGQG